MCVIHVCRCCGGHVFPICACVANTTSNANRANIRAHTTMDCHCRTLCDTMGVIEHMKERAHAVVI